MATKFQSEVDVLIEEVIKTGELKIDDYSSKNIIKIIKKNKNIFLRYQLLIESRTCIDKKDAVNNMIGKRILIYIK